MMVPHIHSPVLVQTEAVLVVLVAVHEMGDILANVVDKLCILCQLNIITKAAVTARTLEHRLGLLVRKRPHGC
jgi:hypothetical protein